MYQETQQVLLKEPGGDAINEGELARSDDPRQGISQRDFRSGDSPDGNSRLRPSIERALAALRAQQQADGHWCAELEGDTILESEYVLCLYFLGRFGEERVAKAANYLRRVQLPEGGWAAYPGGPAEVSASVKAYLVLKLVGDDPQAPHLLKARQAILALGGVEATNSFTRIYLAIFGLYPWSRCPAVPPEMILLPRSFYFNIYAMSSWSRGIVVPLSVIWAHKPRCVVPEHARIPELWSRGRGTQPPPPERKKVFWSLFFRAVNLGLKTLEALRLRPLRRRALARAEAWILERLEKSDGLGAIFPPIVNSLMALRLLGYPLDHPVVRDQMHELEKLEIEEGDTLRVQPCFSPVWDTALALDAVVQAGLPEDDPAVVRAARWLLDKEVRQPGDWRAANPDGPVGGWYFEYANEFYPDCDDTAEVLKALAGVRFPTAAGETERRAVGERGLAWLLSMQNADGGWAAFDKGCDREILTYIPFADHNAMIDPSTTDVSARALVALAAWRGDPAHPAVQRGVDFLRRQQEADGSWYGRWGCNYLYGTWLALQGLRASGVASDDPAVGRAAAWIRGCQNPDGGWGELPASYDNPRLKGQGPSTAAQTAWALMGLFAAGDHTSPSVAAGLDCLLRRQQPDGAWEDAPWTGTGFPKVFYLRYHLYATYFPLQALSEHARWLTRTMAGEVWPLQVQPVAARVA